jgi:hypothetical protein
MRITTATFVGAPAGGRDPVHQNVLRTGKPSETQIVVSASSVAGTGDRDAEEVSASPVCTRTTKPTAAMAL